MADVAGAHQAVDHLLVAAAGVAVELEAVADEDPTGVPSPSTARPSKSYNRTTAPNGTRPAQPGASRRSSGVANVAYATSVEP